MTSRFFYIYVMATSFFYIYVVATSFFYIYVKALTFTLTFTLHLLIDGAASRSIERHFFICNSCNVFSWHGSTDQTWRASLQHVHCHLSALVFSLSLSHTHTHTENVEVDMAWQLRDGVSSDKTTNSIKWSWLGARFPALVRVVSPPESFSQSWLWSRPKSLWMNPGIVALPSLSH